MKSLSKMLISGALAAGIANGVAQDSFKTEFYNGTRDNYDVVGQYGSYWAEQTFTVGAFGTNSNYNIDKISLDLARNGTPLTCLNVDILNVDAQGHPIGASLSHGSIAGSGLDFYPIFKYADVAMTPFTVNPDTKY